MTIRIDAAKRRELMRAGRKRIRVVKGQPRVSSEYLADRVREPGRSRRGRPASKDWYHPSKPGEFPHKDTGHLRRNINLEEDLKPNAVGSRVRVGTNVPYAAALELKMRRLLFMETLRRERAAIEGILTKGKAV